MKTISLILAATTIMVAHAAPGSLLERTDCSQRTAWTCRANQFLYEKARNALMYSATVLVHAR
ncbi:hypothetical protein N7478_009386 [Penicillium angulare]|uniref:uncharacterized protein n=1 Tax=Penicillium angulare TaxID=116970 RepID=UPI002541F33B|nr:uncharacterized protein N7478_009386 [Penicillium angulare]KAJ5266578.1 hypothetical protein N7478_009386 [Penicillium angulare]